MKGEVIPLSKQQIDDLITSSMDNDFYYMLFSVAKVTGRRLGELYGSQKYKEIGRKIIGKKIEIDLEGKEIALSKTRGIYKKIPGEWHYGVKVKDVDLVEGIMKVWVLKRKKFTQDDTILPGEVLRLIRHYIIKNKLTQEDYLFRAKSYRNIEFMVKRYAQKAGIKTNVVFHNFRHYFITELVRQGWSHTKIAKLTGHKSLGTLNLYDHVLSTDIKEDALNALKDI